MTPAPPFDPLAELYERYAQVTDDLYRPWLSAAIPERSTDPTSRAVDLGCDSGRFTGLLADRYSQVLAVDIAEREIALARRRQRRPNVSYQARSLLDVTPCTDGRFDLVLSVNTLFHLCDHDRALPHVRDLLAPGGTLVVVDVVADSPHLRRPAWQHWQTLRDAARTLRRRRRLPDAVAVLRLRLHPAWMTHVTTSTPLTRTGFTTPTARRSLAPPSPTPSTRSCAPSAGGRPARRTRQGGERTGPARRVSPGTRARAPHVAGGGQYRGAEASGAGGAGRPGRRA